MPWLDSLQWLPITLRVKSDFFLGHRGLAEPSLCLPPQPYLIFLFPRPYNTCAPGSVAVAVLRFGYIW